MESKVEQEKFENEEVAEAKYQVIPVQLVESYENIALTSLNTSNNSTKGRYYKQTYRPAWEQMPDFKGWLKGVEGEPTRAFCTYCHKTLHAHRLSLLKHTCTIRHLKAAQVFSAKKNKTSHGRKTDQEVAANEDEENEHLDSPDMEDGDTDHDNEDEEEEDGDKTSMEFEMTQKVQKINVTDSPPISTQVTDLSKGRPITGLQVSLYKLIDGRWTYINEGITNATGGFSQFLERCDFMPGRYKLHYDVDRFFEAKKQNSIFPFVEIVFDCTAFTDTQHIPLLLSPYGYTTFKA